MKRVLITGGGGMLGQALQRLAPQSWAISAPTRQTLDLTHQAAIQAYFAKNHYDLIIHTAAKVGGIKANIADQAGFYAQNTLINLNLIEEARKAGIKNLLNVGSSCMYPRNHPRPLVEEDLLTAPLEPTNEGYALAKITAARHCSYISQQYGLNYKTLIPSNLYGPNDTFDPIQSHLIPAIILKIHTALINNKDTVEIWGDGTARREFIYVDDLAAFIIANAPAIKTLPETLNLGLGHDHTINTYYKIAAKVMCYGRSFTYTPSAPTGMTQKLMNSAKARIFNWCPETSLEDGIKQTYAHYLSIIASIPPSK